jgi:hypothetical protein
VGSASVNRRGVGNRLWLGSAAVAVMLVASSGQPEAQVVPMSREVAVPPWNAQDVFGPSPLPTLVAPDTREDIAPEDTPVRNRDRPDYDPRGLRAGAWMFYPALTAGTFYDSNVFSSPTLKESDVAGQLGAGLRARSLWERHGIDLRAQAQTTAYKDHSSLDETDASIRGTGRFDVDHANMLLGAFEAAYLHEGVGSLTSPAGAIEPTPYSLFSGDATFRHESGQVTLSAGARIDSYDFGSVRARDGTTISQDSRDGQIYKAHGRFDYAFSAKTAFFTAVEGNWRDLRGTPSQSLSSDGYRVLGGINAEFTPLIKGELAAGYLQQRFFDSTIGNVEGPSYRAMLTWSPSRLLDIRFNAEQIVTEASDTTATGILANALQLGADYEFRPNVILSATAAYERDHFKGQTRDDDVYAADARIKYLMNRVVSLALYYRFVRRDSSLPQFTYDKHVVGINAAAHF